LCRRRATDGFSSSYNAPTRPLPASLDQELPGCTSDSFHHIGNGTYTRYATTPAGGYPTFLLGLANAYVGGVACRGVHQDGRDESITYNYELRQQFGRDGEVVLTVGGLQLGGYKGSALPVGVKLCKEEEAHTHLQTSKAEFTKRSRPSKDASDQRHIKFESSNVTYLLRRTVDQSFSSSLELHTRDI